MDAIINSKCCSKCSVSFPATEEFFYNKRDRKGEKRLIAQCKICFDLRVRKHQKNNPDRIKEYKRRSYAKNREKNCKKNRDHYAAKRHDLAFMDRRRKECRKNYYKDIDKSRAAVRRRNKFSQPRRNAYKRDRYKNDPRYRFDVFLRSQISNALKDQNAKKNGRTLDLIGCSPETLKRWIESQFSSGMSWDNHASDGWHIDHIRPCASFDLTDPEQQRTCFHYTNLQPLWAAENCSKKDRLIYIIDYQI